jgi:choline-sulfatase
MTDQLRAFSVGCYGNEVIHTPNIDTLAKGGTSFECAVSNNPLCMPARSSLLSGHFSRTCQGHLKNCMDEYPKESRKNWLSNKTLGEILKSNGYKTNLTGKWHIQPSPGLLGFEEFVYPKVSHRHTSQTFVNDKGEKFVPEQFSPEYEAEQAESFLSREHNEPFFLFYNISPPHMPLADAPDKYLNMYNPKDIHLRLNVFESGQTAYNEEWFKIYLWDYLYYREHLAHTEKIPKRFDLRKLTAMYFGLISWVDDLVGRVIFSLQKNNLEENTILVFLSDHGDQLGSHDKFNKGLLYDESVRIPLIFKGHGILKDNVQRDSVAQMVDIMPTVLSLCGIDVPLGLPGKNLGPVLQGNGALPDESCAFIETPHGCIGIRTVTHMYGMQLDKGLRKIANNNYCFYDMRTDPCQLNNLAGTNEQHEVAMDLRQRLSKWNDQTEWLH